MNTSVSFFSSGTDSPVGVGLKSQHYADVLETRPNLAFFEIHAENFMSEGGAHHRFLEEITNHYALSVHGVGMSLGSASGLDQNHLKRFKDVVERYKPVLISEHLSWSTEGGYYLNDLLPLPLNGESLTVMADNVKQMQDVLGRKVLVENPSAYMALTDTEIPEPIFLAMLVERTGCGLLLDVNNVYVSGTNMSWDVAAYLKDFPTDAVEEIHLAGHAVKDIEGTVFRVDDHGSSVCDEVWSHYAQLIDAIGVRPTLIEWDNDIPAFETLLSEAEKARSILMESYSHKSPEVNYG